MHFSRLLLDFCFQAERQLRGGSSKDSVQISNALAEVTENKNMTMEDFTMASEYFDILTRSLEDVAIDQPGDVDTLVKVGLRYFFSFFCLFFFCLFVCFFVCFFSDFFFVCFFFLAVVYIFILFKNWYREVFKQNYQK